jgi:hypothetical protein
MTNGSLNVVGEPDCGHTARISFRPPSATVSADDLSFTGLAFRFCMQSQRTSLNSQRRTIFKSIAVDKKIHAIYNASIARMILLTGTSGLGINMGISSCLRNRGLSGRFRKKTDIVSSLLQLFTTISAYRGTSWPISYRSWTQSVFSNSLVIYDLMIVVTS